MPVTTEYKEFAGSVKEKKERKSPVPQQYDRILAGALKLSLSQRVEIVKQIHDSIKSEVEQKKLEFEEAQKLVG